MQPLFRAYTRLKNKVLRKEGDLKTRFFKFLNDRGYQRKLPGLNNTSPAGGLPVSPCCRLSQWILTKFSPTFKFTPKAVFPEKHTTHYFLVLGPWPILREIQTIEEPSLEVHEVRYFINILWILSILILFFLKASIAMLLLIVMVSIIALENSTETSTSSTTPSSIIQRRRY